MSGEEYGRFLAHEVPRPGQLEMIVESIEAMRAGGHHLAAAPTGIGKTAAALAAALQVASESESKLSIMFLTGRQSQHRIVVDTVRRINQRENAKVSLVDMIGQSNMCIQDFAGERSTLFSIMCSTARMERSCRPWLNKAPSLGKRILSSPLHVEELVEISRSHREDGELTPVCPWKAARETAAKADIIVGDYNHLFHDDVREASLKAMGIDLENLIVIVDEAHNLPERIRMGMTRVFTPNIVSNSQFQTEEMHGSLLENTILGQADEAIALLEWSNEVLKALRLRTAAFFKKLHGELEEEKELKVESTTLLNLLRSAISDAEGKSGQLRLDDELETPSIESGSLELLRDSLNSVQIDMESGEDDNELEAHRLADLINVLLRFGESPGLVLSFDAQGRHGRITSHLLDPGLVSGPIFNQISSGILMSGTLYPPQMYADLLNIPQNRQSATEYTSPFAGQRRPVLIARDVTTKYTERGQENTQRMRNHIQSLIDASPGHVAVFCPSYALLNEFVSEAPLRGAKKIIENSDWLKSEVDGILDRLSDMRNNGQKALLGGVFGGRLSEGIDYHDGLLDSVVCIGIPNPPPSVRQNALQEYFQTRFGKDSSWRYAVTQPAVNSVLQAMGRPIRSVADRAVILLLDRRHLERNYSRCHPKNSHPNLTGDAESTKSFARRFFDKVHRAEST